MIVVSPPPELGWRGKGGRVFGILFVVLFNVRIVWVEFVFFIFLFWEFYILFMEFGWIYGLDCEVVLFWVYILWKC